MIFRSTRVLLPTIKLSIKSSNFSQAVWKVSLQTSARTVWKPAGWICHSLFLAPYLIELTVASPSGASAGTCSAHSPWQEQLLLPLLPLPEEMSHCSIELQPRHLPAEEEGLGHLTRILGTLETVNHFLKFLKLRP